MMNVLEPEKPQNNKESLSEFNWSEVKSNEMMWMKFALEANQWDEACKEFIFE